MFNTFGKLNFCIMSRKRIVSLAYMRFTDMKFMTKAFGGIKVKL